MVKYAPTFKVKLIRKGQYFADYFGVSWLGVTEVFHQEIAPEVIDKLRVGKKWLQVSMVVPFDPRKHRLSEL